MPNDQIRAMHTVITWRRRPTEGFGNLIFGAARGLLVALLLWQQRASERSRLAALSDHDLADVGLKRSDLKSEIEKPFWQP